MTWSAWRRKTSAGACPWCLMLATRGAVYKSAESAAAPTDDSWHAHCNCAVELETDPGARKAVAVHPDDADRIIAVRPKTMPDRTYTYDLSTFARLDDTMPAPRFRPAGRAVRPGKANPYRPGAKTPERLDSLTAQYEQLADPARAPLPWVIKRLAEVADELRTWFPPTHPWATETVTRLRTLAAAGVPDAARELARRGLTT